MTSKRRIIAIAALAVALAIGWWLLEGDPERPDRTDVFETRGR